MLIHYPYEIEILNKPTKGGYIDQRTDYRLVLNKSIKIIDFQNHKVIGQTQDLSCHGLKIKFPEFQNKKQNIIYPSDQVQINSTWIKAIGIIKYVRYYNGGLDVGLYFDKVKFKHSLFVDFNI